MLGKRLLKNFNSYSVKRDAYRVSPGAFLFE